MRKTRIFALSMVLASLLFGATAAFAGGYPFAVLDTSTDTKVIVLGKFASGAEQFTQAEAQGLVTTIAGLISGTLGETTSSTSVLTPDDLVNFGYDADALKAMVKANYRAWGLTLYVFVDIKKTAEYASGVGPNVRIDVYIADMASEVGIQADYLYALSLETPYMYTGLLGSQ